jgi:hypothetical protein
MTKNLSALGLGAMFLMGVVPTAHALTGAICISDKLNGSLKIRATGTSKAKEIQLGTFDGTTLQFSGINVQVVSGAGATDAAANGKGNLIVGYNKATHGQTRTGSHNLIVGDEHEFTSYGSFVAGFQNTVSGTFASVSGGTGNTASGTYTSVTGGDANVASGLEASVSAGFGNTASGELSSVTGGLGNIANGLEAAVSGGTGLSQPVMHGWAAGSATPGNTINGDFESP